jgi:hypothetical protein
MDGCDTTNVDILGVEGERILPETVISAPSFESTYFDPTQFDPGFHASLSMDWLEFNNIQSTNDTPLLDPTETTTRHNPTPPTDLQWDRIYQTPNEILQSLTVHRTVFSTDTVLVEMSRVLEANKTALQCVSDFLKRDCAQSMPHLTMLYATIIARVLLWYQDAAGLGNLFKSRNCDPSNADPTAGGITPPSDTSRGPMANPTSKCFTIQAQSFSVGDYNVDEPCMQLVFRIQLLFHEVRKAGVVIDELLALAADDRVAVGDQAMYSALGVWLKSEHEKTLKFFQDAIRRMNKKMGI